MHESILFLEIRLLEVKLASFNYPFPFLCLTALLFVVQVRLSRLCFSTSAYMNSLEMCSMQMVYGIILQFVFFV